MNKLELACQVCGYVGLDDGSDGFFYCQRCGSQAEEIRDTGFDADDILEDGEVHTAGQVRRHAPTVIKAEPVSQSQPPSKFWEMMRTLEDNVDFSDGVGPTEPSDFSMGSSSSSYEDCYSEVRLRYAMGVQIMIELQIKALVEEFHVSPLIVGLVESIWLRTVAASRIFSDEWADEAIHESESQSRGEADEFEPKVKSSAEPHNILGKRAVLIWYESVSKRIPLSYSLAISFLVCHLAREPILPTDMVKWALEGKLPYIAAFVEIEKIMGPPSQACPLSSNHMFRPIPAVSSQKLESIAASIARTIGLELPRVNFYAIASRFLGQLSLPVIDILPHACRIFEWSMPPELWLSASEFRLPTRACVMSILIVSIRILYDIHGFGKWEMSLSRSSSLSSVDNLKGEKRVASKDADMNDHACLEREKRSACSVENSDTEAYGSTLNVWQTKLDFKGVTGNEGNMNTSNGGEPKYPLDIDNSNANTFGSQSKGQHCELDAKKLLVDLESKYNELMDATEYYKDLRTYLQYCKDVIFAGLEPSFEDHEESKIIDDLWDFYQKKEDVKVSEACMLGTSGCSSNDHKRSGDDCLSMFNESKKFRDSGFSCKPMKDGSSYVATTQSGNYDSHNASREDKNSNRHISMECRKERAIRLMKLNMEENRFCYIPPRIKVKKLNYLHYTRRRSEGAYTYAAHADYYILLRSCARVVQIDIRNMHMAVLNFEKRLAWLESRIDHCLRVADPNDVCEFCHDELVRKQNVVDHDPMDFSS